tara:strand:- start:104 stop:571 length:468 start_codon:yes stop_codon:yes gene_type:complete
MTDGKNRVPGVIRSLIPIFFFSLLLQYLHDLQEKDCACSLTKDRELLDNTVKTYLLLIIVVILLSLSTNVTVMMIKNFLIFINLLLFLYISVIFFRYNSNLTEILCKCSVDDRRSAFKYYLYFFYAMLLIYFLYASYLLAMVQNKIDNNVSIKKL